MKCKITSDRLKELVDIIKTVTDEAKLSFGKGGLSVKAVDPAHVAMLSLTVNKAAFEEYDGDDSDIGVAIDKVRGVVQLAGSGDVIEITADKNILTFRFGHLTRTMQSIDTAGMSDPKVPAIKLSNSALVPAQTLKDAVRAAKGIKDIISFEALEVGLKIAAEGETDTMDITLGKDADMEDYKFSARSKSLFPLDYVERAVRAIVAEKVVVEMGTDYPMRMTYEPLGGEGKCEYLLAPRIDQD